MNSQVWIFLHSSSLLRQKPHNFLKNRFKDENDFCQAKWLQNRPQNTNRKTDGSTKSLAAKKKKKRVMLLKLTAKLSG